MWGPSECSLHKKLLLCSEALFSNIKCQIKNALSLNHVTNDTLLLELNSNTSRCISFVLVLQSHSLLFLEFELSANVFGHSTDSHSVRELLCKRPYWYLSLASQPVITYHTILTFLNQRCGNLCH